MAIYINVDTLFGPKCIYIYFNFVYDQNPYKADPRILVKWTGSPVPKVPTLYKIHSCILLS